MILFRYLLFVLAVAKCDWFVSGSTWTQQQKLVANDGAASDFGASVALDGDTAVIGAYLDDDKGSYSGSVYVFVRSGTTFTQQQKLVAYDGAAIDEFGKSVALDGDTLVVGAHLDDDKGSNSGSVYVFIRSGTTWYREQKLVPTDGADTDVFGVSVALDGDTLVVGAMFDDDKGSNSGSVYVFVRSGTTWTQQQKLVANDGSYFDQFGKSVALDGDTTVIGAYGDDSSDKGSVYVFVRSGTTWTQQQKLVADDGVEDDLFGKSVALDGDTAVIGAYGDGSSDTKGSVYIFVRSGTTWTQQQKLVANDGAASDFGASVALNGDTAMVGASGSVYVFVRSGMTWTQQKKLVANDGAASAFGASVALNGDTAMVGASGYGGGSAYVFALTSSPPPSPSSSGTPPPSGTPSSSGNTLTGLLGLISASVVAFVLV